MKYYENNSKLFATDMAVSDSSFTEITEQEYNRRLSEAVSKRTEGKTITDDLIFFED